MSFGDGERFLCVCVWCVGTIRGHRERYSRSHIFIVCFIGRRGGGDEGGNEMERQDVSVIFWKVRTFYSNWKKNGSTMN